MVHHHVAVAAKAAKAAKVLFMTVASLCATKQGVDTCLIQADTHLVATRAECVARGAELNKLATIGFGYARMPVPYRVKVHCAPQGKTLDQALATKPDSTGTADLPVVTQKVTVTPEAKPAAEHWYTHLLKMAWPF